MRKIKRKFTTRIIIIIIIQNNFFGNDCSWSAKKKKYKITKHANCRVYGYENKINFFLTKVIISKGTSVSDIDFDF